MVVGLAAAGLVPADVDALIGRALGEDLGAGQDVTSVACVPAGQVSGMDLVARASGTVAGVHVAGRVFERAAALIVEQMWDGPGVLAVQPRVLDGSRVAVGDAVLTVIGPTRALLLAERTALNLICHLSGVATATAAWVEAIAGTSARVRDTRKTTPGMRSLEKFAVRCGGGVNHRMGLWDAALVKDNHVLAAGGVAPAFAAVRERFPGVPVEVEVDDLAQLAQVVDAGADLVLLDNFSVADTARAVAQVAGRCALESSGGLSLAVAADYAATGVDFLAVGALTHSSPILDIGADLRTGEA